MQNATTVILVQAIALSVVLMLSVNGPQTSHTAKPRFYRSYAALCNQC